VGRPAELTSPEQASGEPSTGPPRPSFAKGLQKWFVLVRPGWDWVRLNVGRSTDGPAQWAGRARSSAFRLGSLTSMRNFSRIYFSLEIVFPETTQQQMLTWRRTHRSGLRLAMPVQSCADNDSFRHKGDAVAYAFGLWPSTTLRPPHLGWGARVRWFTRNLRSAVMRRGVRSGRSWRKSAGLRSAKDHFALILIGYSLLHEGGDL
jgi:hypothetical protein